MPCDAATERGPSVGRSSSLDGKRESRAGSRRMARRRIGREAGRRNGGSGGGAKGAERCVSKSWERLCPLGLWFTGAHVGSGVAYVGSQELRGRCGPVTSSLTARPPAESAVEDEACENRQLVFVPFLSSRCLPRPARPFSLLLLSPPRTAPRPAVRALPRRHVRLKTSRPKAAKQANKSRSRTPLLSAPRDRPARQPASGSGARHRRDATGSPGPASPPSSALPWRASQGRPEGCVHGTHYGSSVRITYMYIQCTHTLPSRVSHQSLAAGLRVGASVPWCRA
ncbi:hypothetical protein CDD83_160 [Cordyceps sp. RAO-2017]|nr:hypothetical protein CDD83_160 [Cordyceps sp. RAO-2017]